MEYRLLVDVDVMQFLLSLPKGRRARLINRFLEIQRHPDSFCEYQTPDRKGRVYDACIFEEWTILFWFDFADRHVKIMGMRPAGN